MDLARLSCHDSIKALNKAVMAKSTNYIVEVDIKGFFGNVKSLLATKRCLEERIANRNLLLN